MAIDKSKLVNIVNVSISIPNIMDLKVVLAQRHNGGQYAH
jgi:hypothetical protein